MRFWKSIEKYEKISWALIFFSFIGLVIEILTDTVTFIPLGIALVGFCINTFGSYKYIHKHKELMRRMREAEANNDWENSVWEEARAELERIKSKEE